jgi:hypothetical protein
MTMFYPRRRRAPIVRAAAGAIIAAWTVVTGIGVAHANPDPVSREEYDFSEAFVDTEVCAAEPWGFDVNVTIDDYGFVTVYRDSEGNFLRGLNHKTVEVTLSANGITLFERDQINIFFDNDGVREVGLWAQLTLPHGGIVLLDAGQLVFDSDDNLEYARGRHPLFFGASFCDALMPAS